MPHDIAYSLTFANKDREYLTLRDLLSGYYAAARRWTTTWAVS